MAAAESEETVNPQVFPFFDSMWAVRQKPIMQDEKKRNDSPQNPR